MTRPGALRLHRAYRADPRRAYADTEIELNALGYELLRQGRHGHAIAVFQLNTADHPGSSNAFDSLGEAYMESGRREEAIRSYRRALALDPDNQNARQVLEKLRSGVRGYAGWRDSRALRRRDSRTEAVRMSTMTARDNRVGRWIQALRVILRPTKIRMSATPGFR